MLSRKHYSGRGRHSGLITGLVAVVILAGLSAMLGSWNALGTSPVAPRLPIAVIVPSLVGSAVFVSSGKLDAQLTEGINDELEIDLSQVPNPDPDMVYYAWLLPDTVKPIGHALLLGRLMVDHAQVHFHFGGDQEHSDLLIRMSRLLITEEKAMVPPHVPSLDPHRWRYFGEIPQRANPSDSQERASVLDHIRLLLSGVPTMSQTTGMTPMPGGLRIWLLLTSRDVLEWASAARGEQQPEAPPSLRIDVIRILDVLDGSTFVSQDVPAGIPLYVTQPVAQVPLLQVEPEQQPADYLTQISMQLAAIGHASDATPEQRQIAVSVHTELQAITNALEEVRQDARALLMLSDGQLAQPVALALLDDLVEQAMVAYAGALTLASGEREGGTLWVADQLERLATISVKRCSPCHI